jgi:hypothetical protein
MPLIVLGGGFIHAKQYSGGLFQAEYKSSRFFWRYLRPQATFVLSEYGSGFVGFGFGWEYYLTKHIVVIPSFSPGFYWKGKGKNLGCPLEFRSALEISYETEKRIRVGIQVFHVSNAHLSHKNPGFNALTLCIGFPLNKY